MTGKIPRYCLLVKWLDGQSRLRNPRAVSCVYTSFTRPDYLSEGSSLHSKVIFILAVPEPFTNNVVNRPDSRASWRPNSTAALRGLTWCNIVTTDFAIPSTAVLTSSKSGICTPKAIFWLSPRASASTYMMVPSVRRTGIILVSSSLAT